MRFMQRYGKRMQIGLTFAAGLFLMATALKPQMPNGVPAVGPVWEYASVTASPSSVSNNGGRSFEVRAQICYAGPSGCRSTEQVSANSSDGHEYGDVVMNAATKLGDRGWELAAATEIASDSRRERVLYFKRLKGAINRSESR